MITIPTNPDFDYGYDVDCDGDGFGGSGDNNNVTGNVTHIYSTPGLHEVHIRPSTESGAQAFPAFYLNQSSDRKDLLTVEQWGDIEWQSMKSAFAGAENLEINATDTPDLSGVTDMSFMFNNVGEINQDITDWDVGHVTNMSGMFYKSGDFNQDIGDWDTGSVTDMSYMFYKASSFNKDIGNWDVSNVTDMNNMFYQANSFNRDLSEWDISNVSNMTDMFKNVTLATDYYDAMLNAWSELSVSSGVSLNAGYSAYCDGTSARESLIDSFSWSITDGGESCATAGITPAEPEEEFCAGFKDVDADDELCPAITYVQEEGIFEGYPDGSFKPDDAIKRAETVKVMIEGFDVTQVDDPDNDLGFSDVSIGSWYMVYLATGTEAGIVEGYPDGSFKPSDVVNYVEMIKIFFETAEVSLSEADDPWYQKYVDYVEDNDYLLYDTLNSDMKRGDVATLFYQHSLK